MSQLLAPAAFPMRATTSGRQTRRELQQIFSAHKHKSAVVTPSGATTAQSVDIHVRPYACAELAFDESDELEEVDFAVEADELVVA